MENYEEKYNKAIDVIKRIKEVNKDNAELVDFIEYNYPELKENEDERIRKSIIGFLITISSLKDGKTVSNEDFDSKTILEWVAWLEKQGEQKSATIDIDKMVDDYANNRERGNEEFGKPVNCMIRAYRQGLNDAIRKGEQKPAWSEEDERKFSDILALLRGGENYHYNTPELFAWLKSIKDRFTWKPSDEMLEALYRVTPENVMEKSEDEILLDKLYQGLKYGRVLSK